MRRVRSPHAVRKRTYLLTQDQVRPFTARAEGEGEVSDRILVLLISDTVEQELRHPETHNAAKPNDAWWRCVRSGQSSGN